MTNKLKAIPAFMAAALLALCLVIYLFSLSHVLSKPVKVTLAYAFCLALVLCIYYVSVRSQMNQRLTYLLLFSVAFFLPFLVCLNFTFIGESDLQTYYNNAVKILEGNFRYPSMYAATFPGTTTYPAILATLMKIFGVGRKVATILNCVAVGTSVCCIYAMLKRRVNPRASLLFCLLLSLHPYLLIYSNTVNAELLFGACILYALSAFDSALHTVSWKRKTLWFALSAFALGCSLLFRPLGLILLAAFALVLLFHSDMRVWRRLGVIVAFCCVYVLMSLVNGAIVKAITSYDSPRQSYGWNLYVGMSPRGRWNTQDAEVFGRVLTEADTPTAVQTHFAGEAFARMKTLGPLQIVQIGLDKMDQWYSVGYVAGEVTTEDKAGNHKISDAKTVIEVFAFLFDIPIFVIGLIGCISFLCRVKQKKDMLRLAVAFYFAGTFLTFILLELARRYTISHHILLALPAFLFAFDGFNDAKRWWRGRKQSKDVEPTDAKKAPS